LGGICITVFGIPGINALRRRVCGILCLGLSPTLKVVCWRLGSTRPCSNWGPHLSWPYACGVRFLTRAPLCFDTPRFFVSRPLNCHFKDLVCFGPCFTGLPTDSFLISWSEAFGASFPPRFLLCPCLFYHFNHALGDFLTRFSGPSLPHIWSAAFSRFFKLLQILPPATPWHNLGSRYLWHPFS